MGKKPLLATVVLAILAILLVIPVHDTYTDEGDDYPQYPVHEKAESRYPNLGSDLNQLAANVEAEEADEKAAEDPSVHEAGTVAVTIYLSGETDWMVAFLEDNGGLPRNVGENYIEAFVPVPLLGRLSEQPGVLRIREIVPSQQMGPAATGDGDDIEIILPEKTELKYPNLGSRLNQLVAGVEEGGASAREAVKDAPVRQEESAAVTIYLSGNVGGVVSFLEDNGGSPRNVGEDYIEAYVPVTLLGRLSEQPDVLRVREIVPPQPAGHPATHSGNTVSQGVDVHGAAAWHDAGYKGRGVKVGIITTGFEGLSHLAGTELPSNIVARCYDENIYSNQITNVVSDCEYSGSHGTATAEAVVDMAPEVSLLVANPLTKGDLKTAIEWIIGQGVDVIVHPDAWTFDGPGDGTSPYFNSPLRAIDAAVSGGIVWVNAVGNQARNTWYGAFTDPDGDGFHNFSGEDEHNQISLDEGDRVTAFLRWDDSWGYADCDLSFYLLRRDGTWADLSDDDQNGDSLDDPFEFITYTATEAGDYFLAIRRWSFACSEIPDWLQMTVWSFASLEHYSYERHIGNPAESTNSGMLSVGAARWSDPSQIEGFSSRGPAIDGRTKPDIVGADCGRAVSYPDNNNGCWFAGTSQSAAHVAGMAVLVRDRFPNYTPTQITSYLKDNAEQRGSPDPNNTWGHGFAKLPLSTPAVTCLTGGAVADSANNLGLAADCEVLLAAKDTLAGTATLDWSVHVPIDQWLGVTVAGTPRRVTGLSLGEQRLTGQVPAELGSLTNLDRLELQRNELTGPVPAWLGSLTNLNQLDLSYNLLTGPIPVELGNLSNLQLLSLWGNQLTGTIPAELGNLSNLQELSLGGNQLTGTIPPELARLTNLELLALSHNQLTGPVPSALSTLTNLETLALSDNQLTGPIPAELGNLSNLQVLYLWANQLTGPIPAVLSTLTNLESLVLSQNQLTGPIPAELGSLTSLRWLELGGNQLSGPIPAELGSLTSLRWLELGGNQLSGPIPAELGNLSNLQELSLFGNQLTGPIPSALSSLTSLEVLSLSQNQLSGPIPAELGNLSNLQELSLWGNQLTGPIPASLGSLTSLEVLYLSQNQLTGCVPGSLRDVADNDFAELELPFCASQDPLIPLYDAMADQAALVALYNATGGPNWNSNNNWLSDVPISEWSGVTTDDNGRVTELDLSQNQLTGPIPPALGNLSNLQGLGLWGNQLTGPIPAELGNLSNLQELGLSGNQLTGPIPSALSSLTSLEVLYLWGNQLTGPIPSALSSLTSLEVLYLSQNQLTGPIPAELGNLSNLQELSLFGNQLTGPIPSALSSLTSLEVLSLSQNQLTGPIPAELGNLSNLQELGLSGNQLTGPIPAVLSSLTSLEDLSLWGNQLTGPIPASLGSLTSLEVLYLSQNQLTGPIPAELGNLSNLQELSLWGNQLTGPIPASLGSLTSLEVLYLSQNQLTGPIPAELGSLTSLEVLYLSQNQLTGPIPAELGNLSNLQELSLFGNQLTGPIPSALSSLTSLEVLSLSQNQLTGPIPAELGNLSNLQKLSLWGNQLTGPIPASLGSLTSLEVLYLSQNQLTGCVPGSLRDVADNDFAELELPFCASQDPLITLYDANGDGAIDISELFSAIDDYFASRIDISQLFGVIELYFSGPTPTPRPI